MTKKIIFSTGGTGGHIFPAINLMKHFFEKGYMVLLVTDNRGNDFIKKNILIEMNSTYKLNYLFSFISPIDIISNKKHFM